MALKMLINMSDPEECRIAVVDDHELEDIFIEPASSNHHVGNIYKGRVDNVEPSIQAAFVDCGLERNGFLHVSDVNSEYLKRANVKRSSASHSLPRLEKILKRGQEVVVQVTKSGIGTKGPALTTYLSMPGRFLVLMPSIKRHGVSRKIEDEAQRQRLKSALQDMDTPDDMGVIIRTAGEGRTKRELQRDLNYLQRLYASIQNRIRKAKTPALIYQESDLVIRVVRDFFTPDVKEIVTDSEPVQKKVRDFLHAVMPRYTNRVKLYSGAEPLFHAHGLEKQLESIYGRRVDLAGGGYIIIDQTEALVAIDVNSGSFTRHRNAEKSAYELNLLAAGEIARQLRLRDLSGLIIIDFVDMDDLAQRRAVEKALQDGLKKDKARCRILRMSDFGIVQITRQRMRPSVRRALFRECPLCDGKGHIRTPESAAAEILRHLSVVLAPDNVARVEVMAPPDVAFYLNNAKRQALTTMETALSRQIFVKPAPDAVSPVTFSAFDANGGVLASAASAGKH